jgi:hypothetical protein
VGARATGPLRASGLHRAPAAAEGVERGTMCLGADVLTGRPGRREPDTSAPFVTAACCIWTWREALLLLRRNASARVFCWKEVA